MVYTCPDCGKEYPVPPKWCGCISYPMEFESEVWLIAGDYSHVELTEEEFEEFRMTGPDEDTGYRMSKMLLDPGTPDTIATETEKETIYLSKEDFYRIMELLKTREAVSSQQVNEFTVYKRVDGKT